MFHNFSFFDILRTGGPVMIVLIFCSILSIAVIVERLYYYWRKSRVARNIFMATLRADLECGDLKKAIAICQVTDTPYAAVVRSGLDPRLKDEQEVANAMEREIVIEVNLLEKFTGIVGTIGSTAVYIGLLGTVWGIIKAFEDIAKIGSGQINVVIKGISEALVCTAAGLFVAIPAVIAYNYFVKRINGFIADMELCASETGDLLRKKGHEKKP